MNLFSQMTPKNDELQSILICYFLKLFENLN
jgi:hypothetical protein